MEFFKLARPPPYSGKLLRITHCFDLWHIQIRGVSFNDSLFWSGEGEGGGSHRYEIFFIQFLDVLGYTDHFKRHFFYLYKNNNFYGMVEPPPPFGKFHENYYFF